MERWLRLSHHLCTYLVRRKGAGIQVRGIDFRSELVASWLTGSRLESHTVLFGVLDDLVAGGASLEPMVALTQGEPAQNVPDQWLSALLVTAVPVRSLSYALSHHRVHPLVAQFLASSPDFMVRSLLAGYEGLDAATVTQLASDLAHWVRLAVARRKSRLPAGAFELILAGDGQHLHPEEALARRPDLSLPQQRRLLSHPQRLVRHALAGNPCIFPEIRQALLKDSEVMVRQSAGATSGSAL